MSTPIPVTPVSELTQANLEGSGIFDVLMRATKAHLEQEFNKNRIKGSEYSTVYLGALQSTMQMALLFMGQAKKQELEAQLLEKQIALADAQTLVTQQQISNLQAERLGIEARTSLTNQQKLNAVLEGEVLAAQKCKLQAEYDVLVETKFKTASEKSLLDQKKITEAKNPDVLTAQVGLYSAQAAGFDKDAQYKMKELEVKLWSVAKTTDPDGTSWASRPATTYS